MINTYDGSTILKPKQWFKVPMKAIQDNVVAYCFSVIF